MIHRMMVWGAVVALAACQTRPVHDSPLSATPAPETPVETMPPSTPPEDSNAEQTPTTADAVNSVPPCLPEVVKPKPPVKRHPRTTQEAEKPVPVETQPPRLGSSTPEVKPIDASVGSILGKKIQGADGEDLGRVVDVQADGNGRVRLVIVEFGGFLGVGNRRAAVDWGLLRFHPDDPERPISLSVDAKVVQGTPEYRQASHPQALMAPTAAPTPPPTSLPAPTSPPGPAPAGTSAANPTPATASPPPQNK